MKKCPKCRAELQEEACFCLYCMTSFEEKRTIETPKENNKLWLYIVAAFLVFSLVFLSFFLLTPKGNSSNESNDTSNGSTISSDLNTSTDNSTASVGKEPSSPSSESQAQNTSKNESDTTNDSSTSGTSQNSTTSSNTDTNSSSYNTNSTPSTSTSTNDAPSNVTNSTPTDTQPKYNYVEATIENTYPTGYSEMYAPENAIVITKVNYKEESGNYIIPDTIDEKRVAAVMPSAFCDSSISPTVKSVTLPSTVRTIWSNAFEDCYNLTDIYIKSSVIGIYADAFPATANRTGTLTIHCARDCRNFDFYYYRNIANNYDATYMEWNG